MTSTMSVAAAICSMVSGGITFFRSFAFASSVKITQSGTAIQVMNGVFEFWSDEEMKSRFQYLTAQLLDYSGWALVLLAACCFLPAQTASGGEVVQKGDIVVVPLRGEISPSLMMFLRRAEKDAERNEASAI